MGLCGPLSDERAGQLRRDLREVLDDLRWLVRTGLSCRPMPHDLAPCHVIHDQLRLWIAAGCFEAIVHDLRAPLRIADGRHAAPSAAVVIGRPM